MAHKKGLGSSRNGRDSESKRLGVKIFAGQEVKAGQAVAVIEAMKMQNIIRAERDATVKAVGAKPGDSVAADEVLIEFA